MKRTIVGIVLALVSSTTFAGTSGNTVDLICKSDNSSTEHVMKYGGQTVYTQNDKFTFETSERIEGKDAWLYVNTQRTKLLGIVKINPSTFMYQVGNGKRIIDVGLCERRY